MIIYNGNKWILFSQTGNNPKPLSLADLMKILSGLEGAGFDMDVSVRSYHSPFLCSGDSECVHRLEIAHSLWFNTLSGGMYLDDGWYNPGDPERDTPSESLAHRLDRPCYFHLGKIIYDSEWVSPGHAFTADEITDAILTKTIELDGVGPIRHGSIKIRGVTVICGEDRVGKHAVISHIGGTSIETIEDLSNLQKRAVGLWEYPENGHHPKQQVEIAREIHRIVRRNNINVVISTNSVYLLRALEVFKDWKDEEVLTDVDMPAWHSNTFRLYGMGKIEDDPDHSFIVDVTESSNEVYADFYLPFEEM